MTRFTDQTARDLNMQDLDERIERAVRGSSGTGAHMRVYNDDPWVDRIEQELLDRGFHNVQVPMIVIKGDVWFEW